MKYFPFLLLILVGCKKEQTVHAPAGGGSQKSQVEISKQRARSLNEMERRQIEEWIAKQDEKFFPMPLNYWVNIQDLSSRSRKSDEDIVTYQYFAEDFYGTKIYEKPKGYIDVKFGKFPNDLKAVEDALRYMNVGEEATLLVPSVLGFGTYGDGDKIGNDLPLIVKLKLLK